MRRVSEELSPAVAEAYVGGLYHHRHAIEQDDPPRYLRLGYCLDIVLPVAVALCVEKPEAALQLAEGLGSAPANIKWLLNKYLLGEDNLFITIDAEDLLRSLGAKNVVVENSVGELLTVLTTQSFSFSLLDVSLGSKNSLPVARYMKTHPIPFAFGTGDGEGLSMGEAFVDVFIITKPYQRISMLEALDKLIVTNATAPEDGSISICVSFFPPVLQPRIDRYKAK